MHAIDVIELYINETVRLLPKRQRKDVALELRTLLGEELQSQAKETGQPPNEELALSLVRRYGLPSETAARYQQPWTIIDPADTTNFVRATILGFCTLVLLSQLSKIKPPIKADETNVAGNAIVLGGLAWTGFLVIYYGIMRYIRMRCATAMRWKPHDRDQVNRVGAMFSVPISLFFVFFYSAPIWVLDGIFGGRIDTSGIVYTESFQWFRLPLFLACMAGDAVLLAYVAYLGRWRRLTRRISIAFNIGLACQMLALAVEGNLFQNSNADQLTREILGLVAIFYISGVAFLVHDEMGRVDGTLALANKQAAPMP